MKIKTTNAAILVEQHQPLVVDTIELPEILEYGQVLVKLFYSGICGSQLGEIAGVKGPDAYLPHLLGHEGSGIVEEIGAGVSVVKPGDHVVLHWRKGIGIDAKAPKYRWNGTVLNAGFVTTFNEHAVVSENRLTTIPKEYPIELAPLFGCAITTGLGVITNNAQLKLGESIVILGVGGIGLNVIQGAVLHNAYPIIGVDRFENRLALAKQLGATHTINSTEPDWLQQIHSILENRGSDVVVDNTGHPSLIGEGFKLTHPQGRMILVGVPAKGQEASLYTLPLHFGKRLTGSHGGDGNPTLDIPRYLKLSQLNRLNLRYLITEQYPLVEINSALDRMRNGSMTGRCLIKF